MKTFCFLENVHPGSHANGDTQSGKVSPGIPDMVLKPCNLKMQFDTHFKYSSLDTACGTSCGKSQPPWT